MERERRAEGQEDTLDIGGRSHLVVDFPAQLPEFPTESPNSQSVHL